jgi:chemotaxis protein methyltransferase CheR
LATDINTVSLERAREALYKEWSFRETSAAQREKFFQQEGKAWRVRPEIRSMVTFARLNLVESSYPSVINGTSALDLIVCRNVTIYFDEQTTRQIVDRMFQALAPGGWLIVGHSEPQASVYHRFETHNFPNTVVYRKPPTAPLFVTPNAQPIPPPPLFPAQPTLPVPTVAPRFEQPVSAPPPAPIAPKPSAPVRAAASPRAKRWHVFKSALEQGDADEAALLLDEFMDEAPDDVQALCVHARADLARGNTQRAHQAIEHVLKYDPLCVEAYLVLAQWHEHQGEYEQAVTAYRRAVFLDAACIPGIAGMAGGWKALGRVDLAQRYYQHALKQLAQMPPTAKVAMTDGVLVSELRAALTAQLEQTSST